LPAPGRAQTISKGRARTYEVFHGDYRKLFDAPAEYETISAEEVKQAAAAVLRVENRTVGVLESKAEAAK
jgi:predicted Zn-dependent peptidase